MLIKIISRDNCVIVVNVIRIVRARISFIKQCRIVEMEFCFQSLTNGRTANRIVVNARPETSQKRSANRPIAPSFIGNFLLVKLVALKRAEVLGKPNGLVGTV